MNLLVNVQSNFTMHIGNDSLVSNVLFNVPNGNVHPHTALSSVPIRSWWRGSP